VPVEATFPQAIGQEFLPSELVGKGGEEGHWFMGMMGMNGNDGNGCC
jgi:hypothetical protein